jgi:hypothetical protein
MITIQNSYRFGGGGIPLTDSLISYYKFDESSGVIAADSFGSNDGDIEDSLLINQTGQVDECFKFQHSLGRVKIDTTSGDFDFTDGGGDLPFSFSFWVSPITLTVPSNGAWFLNRVSDFTTADDWQFFWFSSQTAITMRIYNGDSSNFIEAQAPKALSVGTWVHYTVTYDGSETKEGINIYFDAVKQSCNYFETGTYTGMTNKSSQIIVGTRGWNNPPSTAPAGNMDEVKIWGKELTQEEITQDYDNGVAGLPLI